MTFSVQEVPSWTPYDTEVYDLTFQELLTAEQEKKLLEQSEIKIEDTYSPVYQPATPNSSLLGSPSMNMPVLCQYNPYSPAPQMVQSMASPSNTFAHSPGGSSTYSASPVNSPQHSLAAEEYYRYGLRQAFHTRHAQEYGYYGFQQEFPGGKRRKRDDELSNEEYEKRRVRRERNKQAALRCRTRRRERIDALEQETTQIEEDNQRVENEISGLQKQIKELEKFLEDHKCSKHGCQDVTRIAETKS